MSSVMQIEKLSEDNYPSWSIHMKSLLITLDYWSVVDGIYPAAAEERAQWKATDQKALATITLGIKPTELIHIKKCKTAREAWEKLNTVYIAKSPARKVNLFKRLVRFKIQDSIGYSQQINEFSNLVESLKEIDVTVPDDFISILLLCSLPDDFESFIVAIESRDKLPSIDQLKVKILEEHQRRGEKEHVSSEQVFAANSKEGERVKNKRQTNKKHYNVKCYLCGRRGHIRSQCKKQEMVMSVGEQFLNSRENEWIIDSGASSHMSGNKNIFSSLKEYKRKVVLASGDYVFAEGIGNVMLKSEFTDITLCNVLFVPKLNANFYL